MNLEALQSLEATRRNSEAGYQALRDENYGPEVISLHRLNNFVFDFLAARAGGSYPTFENVRFSNRINDSEGMYQNAGEAGTKATIFIAEEHVPAIKSLLVNAGFQYKITKTDQGIPQNLRYTDSKKYTFIEVDLAQAELEEKIQIGNLLTTVFKIAADYKKASPGATREEQAAFVREVGTALTSSLNAVRAAHAFKIAHGEIPGDMQDLVVETLSVNLEI